MNMITFDSLMLLNPTEPALNCQFRNIEQLIWLLLGGGSNSQFVSIRLTLWIWKVLLANKSNIIPKKVLYVFELLILIRKSSCTVQLVQCLHVTLTGFLDLVYVALCPKPNEKKSEKDMVNFFSCLEKWKYSASATCHTTPTTKAWVDRYIRFLFNVLLFRYWQ